MTHLLFAGMIFVSLDLMHRRRWCLLHAIDVIRFAYSNLVLGADLVGLIGLYELIFVVHTENQFFLKKDVASPSA
jgi:hypothetical protein